jgi:hypothetical protein
MSDFDITIIDERKIRIQADSLEDALKAAKRIAETSKPAKILQILPYPYVEKPLPIEPLEMIPQECQCPDCTNVGTWKEYSDRMFKRRSYRDSIRIAKEEGPGHVA